MAKVSDAFPSNWLKAVDLGGKTVKVVIAKNVLEDVGDGDKPILYFEKAKKGLVLNKTNASLLAEAFGDEMDNWAGKEIEVYPTTTSFQGRVVDCLRVRIPVPPAESSGDGDDPF